MKTRKMSLARIQELDRKSEKEVRKFLRLGPAYGDPLPFFLYEEYRNQLLAMARKFGVPPEEFETYVWVQAYIDASAQSDCVGLPSPENIAQRLGIPFADFSDYLLKQIKLIHDALADEDDEEKRAFILPFVSED